MRVGFLALVLLLGCAPETEVVEIGFRDRSVPIASQVDVTASDVSGRWVVRQGFRGRWPSVGSVWVVEADEGGALTRVDLADLCDPGAECLNPLVRRDILVPDGPGRWVQVSDADGDPLRAPLWVLWMDTDRRTAAIGAPDGRYGFIIDRFEFGGEDRITAARDIMQWMGYRTEEMIP